MARGLCTEQSNSQLRDPCNESLHEWRGNGNPGPRSSIYKGPESPQNKEYTRVFYFLVTLAPEIQQVGIGLRVFFSSRMACGRLGHPL